MNQDKEALKAEVKYLRGKADEAQQEVQRANWANRPGDSQYHSGLRVGYLNAANDLDRIIEKMKG